MIRDPRLCRCAAILFATGAAVTQACGTDPTPSIILSIDPTSATVVQGGSVAIGATLTGSGGFTGAGATFALTGTPAGVTFEVSHLQTGGSVTTATITASVAATVPLGKYALDLTGSGTGVTDATADFTLTVSEAPAFTLALSAPALTIVQGGYAQTTVILTRINFPGGVTLTLEGAPGGVSGVFNPTPLTGIASVLTVTVGPAVAPRVYNLTVRGAATGLNDRIDTLALTVSVPDFSLSLNPDVLTIPQGGNGQSRVTLSRANFTNGVILTLEGAPAGVTAAFNPTPPTLTNTSVLTVTVSAAVSPGVYNLMVRGADSEFTFPDRTAPLTLTVTAAAKVPVCFSLSVNPTTLTLLPEDAANATITITRTNGFAGSVAFSGSHSGGYFWMLFEPTSTTGDSVIVVMGTGGPPDTYTLTIAGTAPGCVTQTVTIAVTVP